MLFCIGAFFRVNKGLCPSCTFNQQVLEMPSGVGEWGWGGGWERVSYDVLSLFFKPATFPIVVPDGSQATLATADVGLPGC